MSLLLLATSLLERVGFKQRPAVRALDAPAEPPHVETPRQLRDRLREDIRNRGGRPEEIERLAGNCDQQVATQIANYTEWLATR